MEYILEGPPAVDECLFCAAPSAPDPRERLVLRADRNAVVMLNRFPYNNGHLMVAPRQHASRLSELERAAFAALMDVVREAESVLERALSPDGLNVGLNLGRVAGAGIDRHLHWHLVPRWAGDTNFMPVIGEAKVMPQHLLASYDQLRPYFA